MRRFFYACLSFFGLASSFFEPICNGVNFLRGAFQNGVFCLEALGVSVRLRPMNRKQQGFSLVEMMVAMAIVLILSAGGFTAWQRWQAQQRLIQTVHQLRSYLTLLRNDANWHNRERQVRVKRDGERWCLTSDAAGSQGCGSGGTTDFMPQWREIRLVEITEGLAFFGLRNSAWPGHIRICNAAGEWRVLTSVWGRIRIVETPGETTCH